MKHKMFCIFDSAAKAYLIPFFLPESGMALRVFGDCINSSDHQFGKHPADYTLFELGSFDDSVCVVSCSPSALKVVNGLELVVDGEYEPELPLGFSKGDGGLDMLNVERNDETT